MTDIELRDSYR